MTDSDCKELGLWEKDYEIDGENYYVFTYRELSAKQMTDNVYVKAYIDDNDSSVVRYSILDYATNMIKNSDNLELKEHTFKWI